MSKKHRAKLSAASRYKQAKKTVSRMTLGQVLTHRDKLFAPLKDMKFEAVIQPLYSSDMFR